MALQFAAFDVQYSSTCSYDYMRIYDGPSRSSPVLLDRTCGTGQVPLMVASTNQMLVEFISDGATAGIGFKANYVASMSYLLLNIFTTIIIVAKMTRFSKYYIYIKVL